MRAERGKPVTDTKMTALIEQLRSLGDLVTPMAIRVAATLRLPDLIAEGVTTSDALADRTRTDRDALGRLIRHLTSIGLLRRDGSDISLTDLGEALRSAHPGSPASSLDINGIVGRISIAQLRLLDSIRTGQAGYPMVYGKDFWEDLATDPDLSASFDAHMGSGDPAAAVSAYDWAVAGWVVDVGGGNGNLLAHMLLANPEVRGTVVELAGPAEAARQKFALMGLSERASVVTGSFFDALPAGAGAYVLSNVIHDWPDEQAITIFRRCADAAGLSGTVVVFECVLDAGDAVEATTDFDLFMLVCCGGRQRTFPELERLAMAAGLKLISASPVSPTYGHLLTFRAQRSCRQRCSPKKAATASTACVTYGSPS